jgi:hypothetical protein
MFPFRLTGSLRYENKFTRRNPRAVMQPNLVSVKCCVLPVMVQQQCRNSTDTLQ